MLSNSNYLMTVLKTAIFCIWKRMLADFTNLKPQCTVQHGAKSGGGAGAWFRRYHHTLLLIISQCTEISRALWNVPTVTLKMVHATLIWILLHKKNLILVSKDLGRTSVILSKVVFGTRLTKFPVSVICTVLPVKRWPTSTFHIMA